jgi:protein CpxP
MKNLGTIKTLTIASLSVLALTVSIALAQKSGSSQKGDSQMSRGERHGHDGEGEGRGGGMRGMFFRDLNLTDDQKAKMKQVSQSFRERTQSLHQELRAKREELRQASEGGTFNEALATQKLQESATLQAKLMGEEFKMHQEMLSVLTPEQKTQLEQKRAESKDKWNQGGHHKGDRDKQEDE